MGLFDKKICDICGEKIGLLGNRKLDDGNLCKDCAKKLSPWFEERRHSTVEDIKRQLSISNYARPAWDLEALSNSGVQQFQIDMGVSQRVYMEKNAFYNPTPLFAVCGKKGDL